MSQCSLLDDSSLSSPLFCWCERKVVGLFSFVGCLIIVCNKAYNSPIACKLNDDVLGSEKGAQEYTKKSHTVFSVSEEEGCSRFPDGWGQCVLPRRLCRPWLCSFCGQIEEGPGCRGAADVFSDQLLKALHECLTLYIFLHIHWYLFHFLVEQILTLDKYNQSSLLLKWKHVHLARLGQWYLWPELQFSSFKTHLLSPVQQNLTTTPPTKIKSFWMTHFWLTPVGSYSTNTTGCLNLSPPIHSIFIMSGSGSVTAAQVS